MDTQIVPVHQLPSLGRLYTVNIDVGSHYNITSNKVTEGLVVLKENDTRGNENKGGPQQGTEKTRNDFQDFYKTIRHLVCVVFLVVLIQQS